MQTHIKMLALLHIAFGILGLAAGIFMLALFGGIAGLIGATDTSGDAAIAMPVIGAIGGFLFLFSIVVSLPEIIAGAGLLMRKSWARILTLVLSALQLIQFPFGTALGAYGLWALLSREGQAFFETQSVHGGMDRRF
jgi:hypothetical protein